ncbi:MAG: ferritin-like domain-containing protein [Nitrospiraceae bacterium]|nr:ferritin-like domain-containing protein [Nitrospiraceae bacterium]
MASNELKEMLNKAIAMELQVSIQYLWQHVTARGINSETAGKVFKEIAIAEMKHAEAIADRLDYLGGQLTTKPAPIQVGGSISEMLSLDKASEEGAINLYRKIIQKASEEGDVTTRTIFEGILRAEEDHHNTFSTLLEKD